MVDVMKEIPTKELHCGDRFKFLRGSIVYEVQDIVGGMFRYADTERRLPVYELSRAEDKLVAVVTPRQVKLNSLWVGDHFELACSRYVVEAVKDGLLHCHGTDNVLLRSNDSITTVTLLDAPRPPLTSNNPTNQSTTKMKENNKMNESKIMKALSSTTTRAVKTGKKTAARKAAGKLSQTTTEVLLKHTPVKYRKKLEAHPELLAFAVPIAASLAIESMPAGPAKTRAESIVDDMLEEAWAPVVEAVLLVAEPLRAHLVEAITPADSKA